MKGAFNRNFRAGGFFFRNAATLFVFWLALSGELTALLLLSGTAAALLTAALARGDLEKPTTGAGFFVRFLAYLPWLFRQIALSNLDVAYRVLHPRRPIDPKILRIKNPCRTNLGSVILANSITLTPGTVTIDADGDELIVHAITQGAAQLLLSGEMQARVRRIEGGADV
ncbi:MAG: Na+/H+ antiporter subunit E [Elusimicrobia bacterium]|nr:Na+/H+ antiporter subunit E [Elusimicrobiota bacterium]